jgi:hypothetical protein
VDVRCEVCCEQNEWKQNFLLRGVIRVYCVWPGLRTRRACLSSNVSYNVHRLQPNVSSPLSHIFPLNVPNSAYLAQPKRSVPRSTTDPAKAATSRNEPVLVRIAPLMGGPQSEANAMMEVSMPRRRPRSPVCKEKEGKGEREREQKP